MELICSNKHASCLYYEKREKPQIEICEISKGKIVDLTVTDNKIICLKEGKINILLNDTTQYQAKKGKIFLLPSASKCQYQAVVNSTIIIFRIQQPLQLCEVFTIDKLYLEKPKQAIKQQITDLQVNQSLTLFLEGLYSCILQGMKCQNYFNIKMKELLFYLRIYYTKEDLWGFFSFILTSNITFSEHIRLHWQQFSTIAEMAQSMNMTHKQFFARFVKSFGTKPQKWLNQQRMILIYSEIKTSKKQFKQISLENGFSHEALLTRFCKKQLGATPTQIREEENIREKLYAKVKKGK